MSQTDPESPIVRVGHSEFDMTRAPDRGMIHRAFVGYDKQYKKRWEGIDEALKADILRAAKVSLRLALERGDPRAITGATAFLASLERDNQADEHLEFRANRGVDNTQINILNNVQSSNDPRTVLSEMLRDPAKAVELGRLADKLGPPDKTQHV